MGTPLESSPIYCRRPSSTIIAPNFCEGEAKSDGPSPKPKPRKSKVKSSFQSHVVERWEEQKDQGLLGSTKQGDVPPAVDRKASFQSHLEVPEGKLLDFSPSK